MSEGRLVLVGSGITLGKHISQRVVSEIKCADVVFCMTDSYAFEWIRGFRPDVIGLHIYYGYEKDRRSTYREMDAAIMAMVREGKQVCAVFYGHPGVFADVPHEVIRKARAEGFEARMEPGVSAEACLYADLGIDPGARGVQSFEATQFLVFDRVLDATALLILWQVALAGDLSCTQFSADPRRLSVLRDKLLRWYPHDTEIILYEAAQLPVGGCRADYLSLSALPEAAYQEYTTLVIPPVKQWGPDQEALSGLGYTEADLP